MKSQDILWVATGISVLFYFLFLFKKTSSIGKPSKLNLRNTSTPEKGHHLTTTGPASSLDVATRVESDQGLRIKSLNVMFMHNGHSFDANEVLGVPAGANLAMIEKAYKELLKKVDPESKPFVDTAYQCLIQEMKR